jgi:STE24 endopeptidase
MNTFTWFFLLVLTAGTAARIWLARRHAAYVRAHEQEVPREFAQKIPLEAHRKAASYTRGKVSLSIVNTIIDVAVLLAFTLGGGLELLAGLWRNALQSPIWGGVGLITSVIVIGAIIDLPFTLYRIFGIEAKFGFNKMTPALFLSDLAKQALLAAAIGIPILLAALWMMDRLGERWWLYAWGAWVLVNLFLLAVYPTWIAPIFNKFSPLDNPELRERVERLLTKCGFKSSGLFVMDGSTRSSHGNAYFTGFGKTKRIVFFDTLLNTLDGPEVEAVLAHELGHFKRRHVIKRIALTFAGSLVFLWLLGKLMQFEWFFHGLGVQTPSTAMALMLFVLVLPVFTFVFQPLASYYARRQEFEADEYASQHTNASDLISALVKLYKDNASTLTPDPLHSAFYDSHPPASIRISRLQMALR